MERTDGGYRAETPGEYLDPERNLTVYLAADDNRGTVLAYPGLWYPTRCRTA